MLFVVGYRTGFRISALLSLLVGDVQQHGKGLDHVTVQPQHMKKKRRSARYPCILKLARL